MAARLYNSRGRAREHPDRPGHTRTAGARLTATGAEVYDADHAGVPGAAETDDRLGSAVAPADLTGDGDPDLVLGADGENAGDGTVLTLNGGPDGVVPESGAYYGPTALGTSAAAGIGGVLAK